MTGPRHALVAGATGLIGSRVAHHLATSGWTVVGLCRRAPTGASFPFVEVDLASASACRSRLVGLDAVTHLFYCARFDHPEGAFESTEINGEMLTNLLDALAVQAPQLAHVNLVHGTKYYGHHLGPVPSPLTEDSPRGAGGTYYFAQEDLVRARSRTARWRFSIARPHTFLDAGSDEPRSFALLLAVYATIMRELGLPFDFPGTQRSYAARTVFTSLPLLARAVTWMATDPRCANQAYNVVNGDAPAWAELWPRFARYFDLPLGQPRPFDLATFMATKKPLWQSIVHRSGLIPAQLDELVLWPYGNYVVRAEWDIVSAMTKARRDGFAESVDTAAAFESVFDRLRAQSIVP
ncbi:MAG: NAD-dependent epimerase/dehydratase family protein [Proteobacteria bacterium]|nr:NAD-dependent epimerase/dehydratase family protein [Burkholderiales bacterium]